MNIRPIILFTVVLCLSSCESFFETTLELESPTFEKRLVVQAEGVVGSNTILVKVGENFGITDREKKTTILKPKITINVGNEIYQGEGLTVNILLSEPIKSGQLISLKVEHPGFPVAISTQVAPEIVELANLKYYENGGINVDGEEVSKVDVTLQDPDSPNFYQATIVLFDEEHSTFVKEPGAFNSLNYYGIIFNDLSFNGKKKDLSLQFYSWWQTPENIYVEWKCVTEDYYKYHKTGGVQYDNNENPFATPADVYSNIKDGLGFFNIYSIQKFKV